MSMIDILQNGPTLFGPIPHLGRPSRNHLYARASIVARFRKDSKMPLSATVIGALLGLSTQMYSNSLRKLPYMRHPWEHVVGMGLGVVFVTQLAKWDDQLKVDLDKMLDKAKAANERRYFDDDDD